MLKLSQREKEKTDYVIHIHSWLLNHGQTTSVQLIHSNFSSLVNGTCRLIDLGHLGCVQQLKETLALTIFLKGNVYHLNVRLQLN